MTLHRPAVALAAGFWLGGWAMGAAPVADVVQRFCADCHDAEAKKGGLDLEALSAEDVGRHTTDWERVVRQLRARQMPPLGKERPDEAGYEAATVALITELDRLAAARPQPGRTQTLRRLTRTEYQNAIRDVLDLEIDAKALLPPDESSHGFDNVTVGDLSPARLDRYITAAQRISRLALGGTTREPEGTTIRIRPDITQEDRVAGLPLGTRGGALIRHTFAQDGVYEIEVHLMRDRNELVEGLHGEHELEVLLDRQRMAAFTIQPPPNREDHTKVDADLKARFSVTAGPHEVGATFVRNPASVLERLRQPYKASFNFHRHPRLSPAVFEVSITGPFEARGPGDTPSRRRLFGVPPASPADEDARAGAVLSKVMRRAYRRPVVPADLEGAMAVYHRARAGEAAGFEAGIEAALSAILVSSEFLFRTERDPDGLAPRTPYRVSDLELASRLSFFLWSSVPDDGLLDVAARGELGRPGVLERETRRLLADARAHSLVTNFADQWLHLRNLDSITPDGRLFPDFDDNLRQAFRTETNLLFESVLREDRSVLDLLRSDRTWLNQRLAQHYGIPNVYGDRFRQVRLDPESRRGGLLRHGSILTVTSYATRTSPVIRGHWILKNLLGTPPPPPPPNVPTLEDNTVSAGLPMRERLVSHRANPACATCHQLMDPVGFALENFDALGRWRESEDGRPVDATGGLPDGGVFAGVSGLEEALLRRPDMFVGTLTENLLTFALGRGMEPDDAPAVRQTMRHAAAHDFRFSDLIVSIVSSPPFQMRTTP